MHEKTSMEWVESLGWLFQDKAYSWHGIRLESRGPVLSEAFIYQSSALKWLSKPAEEVQTVCVIVEDFEPYYAHDAKFKFEVPSHLKSVLLQCLKQMCGPKEDD